MIPLLEPCIEVARSGPFKGERVLCLNLRRCPRALAQHIEAKCIEAGVIPAFDTTIVDHARYVGNAELMRLVRIGALYVDPTTTGEDPVWVFDVDQLASSR